MGKRIIVALVLVLSAFTLRAIPARPGAFSYTQPDGSVIRLERHGDEFFSWTTLAGTSQVVEMDADGFWRPSSASLEAGSRAASRRRMALNEQRTAQRRGGVSGTQRVPVILVNFKDLAFVLENPREMFHDMLNREGYSDNGGHGSVRDFYMENSHGAYTPEFDVYGPVTLPEDMAFYGANEGDNKSPYAHRAVVQACQALEAEVDFSQYDQDSDGQIDMILFYFAGYNEAEGGPEETLWPHQWNVQASRDMYVMNVKVDGKKVGRYFCTSELKGSEGADMCSIGTTCHEFAHSLGLPDFYDTNGKTDGECGGLYWFSTMCYGSYLDGSTCPPYFNSMERMLLGWMEHTQILDLPTGVCSFGSVKDNIAYCADTSTDGEFFLFECRDRTGWDSALPAGLVIYHVDMSHSHYVGETSAYNQWQYWVYYNKINAYGDHPCFYVSPSAEPSSLLCTSRYLEDYTYPGRNKVHTYNTIDWEDVPGAVISGINYNSGRVSLFTYYPEQEAGSFASMGFNTISDPGQGEYKAGDTFTPELVTASEVVSVSWSFDSVAVSEGRPITLQAGEHTVRAALTLADGSTESLELVIRAN